MEPNSQRRIAISSHATDGFATPETWKSNKETIENLYMTRNLALIKVKDIMEMEHGLKATLRMYKSQFKKWGWHKYNSRRLRHELASGRKVQKANKVTRNRARLPQKLKVQRANEHSSLQNFVINFAATTSKTARSLLNFDSRVARLGERYPSISGILHQNDNARNLNNVFFLIKQYIHGEAERSPRWMTCSEFDDPFGGPEAWRGAGTYHDLLNALEMFRANEYVVGGRLLRRAFQNLDEELRQLSLIQSFEYCCSIPHLLVNYHRPDLAKIVLQFVANRISLTAKQHPLVNVCEPLSQILQTVSCRESLSKLVDLAAAAITELRGNTHRNALYFWSRCRVTAITPPRAEEIATKYETLRSAAMENLGGLHPTCLYLETGALAFAARFRTNPQTAACRSAETLARIEKHYDNMNLPIKAWDYGHQKVYVDASCLLSVFYARAGQVDNAIRQARRVYTVTTTPSGGLPLDIWKVANVYLVWFELSLLEIGRSRDGKELRKMRMNCEYYKTLERDFAQEEKEFVNSL